MAEKKSKKAINTMALATPAPLDGGWAWMVVVGCGLVLIIMSGFGRAYTLIYKELLNRYEETDVKTSAVSAINGGVNMFTGTFPTKSTFNKVVYHKYQL